MTWNGSPFMRTIPNDISISSDKHAIYKELFANQLTKTKSVIKKKKYSQQFDSNSLTKNLKTK